MSSTERKAKTSVELGCRTTVRRGIGTSTLYIYWGLISMVIRLLRKQSMIKVLTYWNQYFNTCTEMYIDAVPLISADTYLCLYTCLQVIDIIHLYVWKHCWGLSGPRSGAEVAYVPSFAWCTSNVNCLRVQRCGGAEECRTSTEWQLGCMRGTNVCMAVHVPAQLRICMMKTTASVHCAFSTAQVSFTVYTTPVSSIRCLCVDDGVILPIYKKR